MGRLMKISFSVPLSQLPSEIAVQDTNTKLSQTINFFNMSEGYNVTKTIPLQIDYKDYNANIVALLNYKPYEEIKEIDGTSKVTLSIQVPQGRSAIKSVEDADKGLAVTIFRQEIGFNDQGEEVPLTIYYPVDTYVTHFHLRDYNIANNRYYKYIIYPAVEDKPLMSVSGTALAKWSSWSITELHPVKGADKRYTVSADDVWIFNANVSTGEQTQNIVMNEQQTLGEFARYSQAKQSFISSNVSCLLGEVLPANYIRKMQAYNVKNPLTKLYVTHTRMQEVQTGGYQENTPSNLRISSNDKVDMLLAWRKMVHSGNPKLLKDRKGQSFLISITESSNKTMDDNHLQPDTISFSWVQIGTLEDVQIVETAIRGGIVNG